MQRISNDGKARQSRPITRKVLRDDVYDELLERLLDGEYPPETSISIDGLARDLGVSPTPVREALVQLEHTTLVSRAALKGYRVAPPLSATQMAELIEARTVVEIAAIERAVDKRAVDNGTEFLASLRAAHERHKEIVRSFDLSAQTQDTRAFTADMRAYFDADWEFHSIIMKQGGNRYLHQMLDGLSVHVHRLRQVVNHGVSDAEAALAEHKTILEALEAGHPGEAMIAMQAHLAGVKARSAAGTPDN